MINQGLKAQIKSDTSRSLQIETGIDQLDRPLYSPKLIN